MEPKKRLEEPVRWLPRPPSRSPSRGKIPALAALSRRQAGRGSSKTCVAI